MMCPVKLRHLSLVLVLVGAIACEEDSVYEPVRNDERLPFTGILDPLIHHDAINRALTFSGTLMEGVLPAGSSERGPRISSFQSSASVTADNTLFLPFQYTADAPVDGVFISIPGADSYWDVPITNGSLAGNQVVSIGIPTGIIPGQMSLEYELYDANGNIGQPHRLGITIVSATSNGGGSRVFPVVNGSDGLTVRTYDVGAVEGDVYINWNTFVVPDRIDIRHGTDWILSTGTTLDVFGAPPVMDCEEAHGEDGFVGSSSTFHFPLDATRGSRFDIYVSGCLNGGTAWDFQVTFQSAQLQSDWTADLPDCPCSEDLVPVGSPQSSPISGRQGRWVQFPVYQQYHPGAISDYRWVPYDVTSPSGQQCIYDAEGRLITSGLGAGSPDRHSPGPPSVGWDGAGGSFGEQYRFLEHRAQDMEPWSSIPCEEYLRLWPSNTGNCPFSNPVRPIDHILGIVRNMTCDEIVQFESELISSPSASQELLDYVLKNHGYLSPGQIHTGLEAVVRDAYDGNIPDDFYDYQYSPIPQVLAVYSRLGVLLGLNG